jgi:hypothetical protein
MQLIHSIQSEWLKTRRSLAAWLVIIGGFFIPGLQLIGRCVHHQQLGARMDDPRYWETFAGNNWQVMSLFLLPMGVVLATSLITQLEFRNNTWKQVHTTPQAFSTIFVSKLSVILTMMLQFMLLFNIGMFLAGILPSVLFSDVDLPKEKFPFRYFWDTSYNFFICSLPVIALQYLISLQFRNFMIPLGLGLGLVIAALIGAEWKHGYWIPYAYTPYNFFIMRGIKMQATQAVNIHHWALGYALVFTILAYVLYIFKRDKG